MKHDRVITQAVILAGGLGTRLRPYTNHHPKAMYPFEGVPFLEYLLLQIRSFGITEIVLLLGYLAEEMISAFGDGSGLGLHILYDITPVEYDTGARLRHAAGKLNHHFLMLYCDNYCPLSFQAMVRSYFSRDTLVQITAYVNPDSYTKNNLLADEQRIVRTYDKSRTAPGLNMVDIGYALIDKRVVEQLPCGNVNFERELYPALAANGQLGVFPTEHRYYSVGSWERIQLTTEFFHPKKVVFLDRDGTLNICPPKACYVSAPEEFVWLPKAREAVALLKQHGYMVILVTNQPGISRGMVSEEAVGAIHAKMRRDLKAVGADIDALYMCPHGWNEGCRCRKPKPGMLFQAQKDFSLDLSSCVMIGDDSRDMEAGSAAGCKLTIAVSRNYTLYDAVSDLLKRN